MDVVSSILGARCGSVSNAMRSNSYSTSKVVGLMAADEVAVALAAMCEYTLSLLSACAPEALRPFAPHNMQAIINKDFHRVTLPSLQEVENIIRNRNSPASRRNSHIDPVFLCGAPDADRRAADDAAHESSSSSSISSSSSPTSSMIAPP